MVRRSCWHTSLLRTVKPLTTVILTVTEGSEHFYKRFGFKFVYSLQPTSTYRDGHYFARVTARDRARCSALLRPVVTLSPEIANETVPELTCLESAPTTVADA